MSDRKLAMVRSQSTPRRVLFFCYTFDATTAGSDVVGTIRPGLIIRYLPENGWRATVLTAGSFDAAAYRAIADVVIVEGGGLGAAKRRLSVDATRSAARAEGTSGSTTLARIRGNLLDVVSEIVAFLPDHLTWALRAGREGLRLHRAAPYDAIYSTSPTPATHLAAWIVSIRTGIPWFAELRDLWSQHQDRRGSRVRRALNEIAERTFFRRAASIVTVSDGLAVTLRRLHHRPVTAIPTGIDPDLIAPVDQALTAGFTIVYAGRLFPQQSLAPFFRAVRAALDQGWIEAANLDIRLLTMGTLSAGDRAVVEACGLGSVVHEYGPLPREQAIAMEREAQVLLHVRWDVEGQAGLVGGKIFEYLAARRPILSIGAYRDAVARMIEDAGAGRAATSEPEAAAWLRDAYAGYLATGGVPFGGNPTTLGLWDARSTTARIAATLDKAGPAR